MMKKRLMLPLMFLSISAFVLAGCGESETVAGDAGQEEAAVKEDGVATDEMAEEAEEAQDAQSQAVTITDAYAFATAEGARTGAIFAKLKSNQQQADILISARSELAEIVELHQTYTDPQTGTVLMRKTSGIDLAAGRTVTLEPTGFHIMLINLKRPLIEGEEFDVTLQFRRAGRMTVPVTVTAPGLNPGHADHHDHHDHHDHGDDNQDEHGHH